MDYYDMNIDLLIKMTNEIGAFFDGAVDREQAARDVATHLKRYWEPRMRRQMLDYYRDRAGAGLTDTALGGVALLAAEAGEGGAPPRADGGAGPTAGAR